MDQPPVKQMIFDNFYELSKTLGFKKVTVDMLAKKCRISKKTIYAHFKDKNEIVKYTADKLFSRLGQRIIQYSQEDLMPLEKINTFFDLLFELFGNASPLILHDIKTYFPEVQNEVNQIIKKISDLSIKDLQKGIEKGIYNDVDPKITVTFMTNAAIAVMDTDFLLTNNITIDQAIESYKKLALSGILKKKE